MKRQLIYLLAAAATAAVGCAEKETLTSGNGLGRIVVAGSADGMVVTRGTIETPAAEEFRFSLSGDDYEGLWQSVAAFSQSDTMFREGSYTAGIAFGDPEAEGPGMAYFAGKKTFDLKARHTTTVSITARLGNSQTLVRATEQFLAYFHDAQFTVTTASGHAFVFTPGGGDAADAPVFVKAGTTLTVTGTARRQSQTGTADGPLVEFSATPLAATKPRTCHIFTFDAADAGSATVKILLSEGDSVIEPVTVELNDQAFTDENR